MQQTDLFAFCQSYQGLSEDMQRLAEEIEELFLNEVDNVGYYHSRDVADKIEGYNTKQVAVVLRCIADESRRVNVQEWSKTNAINWRVEA